MEQFLLPEENPIREILDRILQNCPIISIHEMEKLGFKELATGRTVCVMVSHELPDYVCKVPLPNRDISPKFLVERADAHKYARENVIEQEKMKAISATPNWLYPIFHYNQKEITAFLEFNSKKAQYKKTFEKKAYLEIKNRKQKIFNHRLLFIEPLQNLTRFDLSNHPQLDLIIHEYALFLLLTGEPDAHDSNVLYERNKHKILFFDLAKRKKNPEKREIDGVYALLKDHIMSGMGEEIWKNELSKIKIYSMKLRER